MRIGILGPVSTRELAPLLDDDPTEMPPGNGGYPLTLLVAELVRAGHEVRVWTLDPTVDRRHDAQGEGLHISYLPYRANGRGRDLYATERRWLVEAMVGEQVDLLNAHWSYEYALAAMTRPEPMLLTVHDWAPAILRYQTDPYRLIRLGMYARVHLARPRMTTPSPYVADRLSRFGLGRAQVVPNGVPDDLFIDRPRHRGTGHHLLGVAMGFSRLKNTASLLRANALLRAAGMPTTLTLIGADHGPGEAAQDWAVAKGVADGVVFAGLQPYDRTLEAIGSCDLFVHPGRQESFGMVLIEAMAQGTPVIGGRSSGAVPWVLDHGTAGQLVDVTSPHAIAIAVQRLLASADAWGRASAAGLAHTRSSFAMSVVRRGYLQAYADTLVACA